MPRSNQYYWAVRPIRIPNQIRIEKAETARQACALAFGRGIYPNTWEAKNLGSRLAVIQSDNKRIALLKAPDGWASI